MFLLGKMMSSADPSIGSQDVDGVETSLIQIKTLVKFKDCQGPPGILGVPALGPAPFGNNPVLVWTASLLPPV